MKIYLDPDSLKMVLSILKKNEIHSEVYVFGSRSRGDHNEYSDLDLLLKQSNPLETRQIIKLNSDFEDSDLPIAVDFIEWSKISDDFKEKIKSELVPLF